jgi:D-alanyl-D-alanine carboxypeptidase/D-alanyl-D-alanine-endopeptidase (penicillin-binding protein 4)
MRPRALVTLALTLALIAGCAGGAGGGGGAGGAARSAGGSSGGGTGSSGGSSAGSSTGSTPAPAQPPPLPPIDPARRALAAAAIDAALADPALAGHTASVLVLEDESGEVVYARDPDRALIPASNTKLFTTAAALALLGPDHRFETRALASVAIDASGTLAGDLTLWSEHDFTLTAEVYESDRYPLDRIAERLHAAGLRRVAGGLRVTGAWVYDAVSVATYDPARHRAAVEGAFLAALQAQGITVAGGSSSVASLTLPSGLVTLASWRSVPLSVAASPINVVSHNEMADALCRHLGWRLRGSSDYASGTQAVLDWAASIGVPGAPALFDGSGLDVRNRVSARQLVELIRRTSRSAIGPLWESSFAVGGVSGTLAGRMGGADVRGRFFGKSGTNLGICTSGVLWNRHDGRRYVVSVLMNSITSSQYGAARAAEDAVVAAVAGDLRGAGTRPAAPVLASVVATGAGSALVRWSAVPGARGYVLHASADGEVFAPAHRIYLEGTSAHLSGLTSAQTLALRVTAVSAAGESDPSDTYAFRMGAGAAPLLVVDANDRWQREAASENAMGAAHRFAARLGVALPARIAFDACADEEVGAGAVDLARYRAVLWLTGEEGSADTPVDAAAQGLLRAYVSGGGRLLLSGAEALWDLDRPQNPDPQDHAFARDVLGAAYVADDAGTYVLEGAGGALASIGVLGFFTPGEMRVQFPDVLAPSQGSGALPLLRYAGGSGGSAALAFDRGAGRVVTTGFPLESIDAAEDRRRVLDALLGWFGL